MEEMNSTNTHRAFGIAAPAPIIEEVPTAEVLLARLRHEEKVRRAEDHIRQCEAEIEWIKDEMTQQEPDLYAVEAHARAGRLHRIALDTDHPADRDRAWQATMEASTIDGSV